MTGASPYCISYALTVINMEKENGKLPHETKARGRKWSVGWM